VPTGEKILPLGRIAFEMGLVMPDNRTVYMADDGTNVGFFKFVADTPGNLMSGSLYAAKANQVRVDIYIVVFSFPKYSVQRRRIHQLNRIRSLQCAD
jgi:hypothetical protein